MARLPRRPPSRGVAGPLPIEEAATLSRLKLVTYNVHSGVGVDGRYDIDRIASVLGDETPDVVGLQELDCGIERSGFHDQASMLADHLGMTSSFCATCDRGAGRFGIAVLSRFPVASVAEYDLSYGIRREPRSCVRVDLELEPGVNLHVFNCHLGLATLERRYQRRRMLSDAILLSEELHHPVVLMGDFNDRPLSVVHPQLRQHFVDAYGATGKRGGATFRRGPLSLKLDHIYVSREFRVVDCDVRRTGHARVASDHRPLVAEVELTIRKDSPSPR